MCLIAPLLAVEVDLLIAPAACGKFAILVLGFEALHAGPGVHQHAVDLEVIRRKKRFDIGLRQGRSHELGRELAFEQTAELHESAEQQVELQP